MAETVMWKCPLPRALSQERVLEIEALTRQIFAMSRLIRSPVRAAGLELRAAMFAMEGSPSESPDNIYWETKCRRLLVRPAVEPVVHSYWPRLTQMHLDHESALNLVSALAGQQLQYRDSVVGRSPDGDVLFETPEVSASWIQDIRRVATDPQLHHLRPFYYFARVLTAHPFTDGNGRFARMLMHIGLAQICGLSIPTIALAPAFYRQGRSLRASMNTLCASGDWDAFAANLCRLLAGSITLTRETEST